MRLPVLLQVTATILGATAQMDFEKKNFNVIAALEELGVNVSSLPPSNNTSSPQSTLACTALSTIFGPEQTLASNSTAYDAFTGSYWSAQQGALDPYCVFKPASTRDVSILVLIARLYSCPFAVKGGGHAAFAGASSIEDGITVSMENFKQAQVSTDKTTVDIGPGLRWIDVYTEVEKSGLSVVGGRMSPVGVPGLILGGGISHFSNKFGWACDNVASYELVTAKGLAIDVSPTSYPDLYWALRGGGNNFGIVTNFKLRAFPQGQMWGGMRIYLEDAFSPVLDAIHQFTVTGSSEDTDAAQIITFASAPGIGKVVFANLHYAKPVANAPVFSMWSNISSIQDTTGIRSMAGMADLLNEGSPAPGAFQTWWGISLKMDRELLQILVDAFYTQEATIADVEKILFIMAVQPITEGALKGMQQNGGNALGLDPENGPYFVLNFNAAWTKKEDEPKFHKVIHNIIGIAKTEAKKRNLDNDFVYLNYGSEYQDPIGSYGQANKERLIEVSKKYDPAQVFQYLQPGGFKLVKGAPNPTPP